MPHPQGIRRIKDAFDFREEIDRLADYCDLIALASIAADREGLGLGDSLPTLATEMRERLKALGHAYDARAAKWARQSREAQKRRAAERAALPLAEGDTLRVVGGERAGTEAVVTKAYDSGGEVVLRLQPGGDGAAEPREVRAEVTAAPAADRPARTQSAEAREAVAPLAAVLAGPPPPTVPPETLPAPVAAPAGADAVPESP